MVEVIENLRKLEKALTKEFYLTHVEEEKTKINNSLYALRLSIRLLDGLYERKTD